MGLLVLTGVVALVIAGSGDARDTQPKQPPTPPAKEKQKPPAHKTKKKTTGVPKGKKKANGKAPVKATTKKAGSVFRLNLRGKPVSDTRARLMWNLDKNVDRYDVFRGNPTNPRIVKENLRGQRVFIVNGLSPGQAVRFFVVAYKDKNDLKGTTSNVVVVTTKAKAKPPPADVAWQKGTNKFDAGQCTWYVDGCTSSRGWVLQFSTNTGRDAHLWYDLVTNATKDPNTPRAGSIMVLDTWSDDPNNGKYGHVAFVETVADRDHWTITHANFHRGEKFQTIEGKDIYRSECTRDKQGFVRVQGSRPLPLLGFLSPP